MFDDERSELLESADESEGGGKDKVLETRRSARSIVGLEVLFGDSEPDEVLDALSPLWTWLQDNRRGLLQADGEGYYDVEGLILALD